MEEKMYNQPSQKEIDALIKRASVERNKAMSRLFKGIFQR